MKKKSSKSAKFVKQTGIFWNELNLLNNFRLPKSSNIFLWQTMHFHVLNIWVIPETAIKIFNNEYHDGKKIYSSSHSLKYPRYMAMHRQTNDGDYNSGNSLASMWTRDHEYHAEREKNKTRTQIIISTNLYRYMRAAGWEQRRKYSGVDPNDSKWQ